jgi:hypothetical protein
MTDVLAEPLSTQIDATPTPSAAGGGQTPVVDTPKVDDTKPRPASDDLRHVFKADDRKERDAEKAKVEPAKDDKASEPKDEPAEKDETEQPAKGAEKEEKPVDKDGRERARDLSAKVAPKGFALPQAKELWRNTPRPVQAEVERIVNDYETKLAERSEHNERYEAVRPYVELAERNGTTLDKALARYNALENAFRANPLHGIQQMLLEAGPTKPDGQKLSLYEVAQAVMQMGPDGYQQAMQQVQQPTQHDDNEVQQLRQQIEAMQMQQQADQYIGPFRAEHPRFDELHDHIVMLLESGIVPASLSPTDKLSAAYDMAERINPPSHVDPIEPAPSLDPGRADDGFSGTKSIKSAPGSVSERTEYQPKASESVTDSLRAELRRLNRA